MSDKQPNLELRKRQIRLRIMELELNMERMSVRKDELDDEKRKIDENLEATTKAIIDLKTELEK